MSKFNNPLDHVRVASPCKADWDEMIGTNRVRFCSQCSLNVYNLSSMTKTEAESLIAQTEGRLCVRFYRRTDGSILTKNCPVGLRAMRKRVAYLAKAAAAAVLSFFAGLGFHEAVISSRRNTPLMGVMVETMGDMVIPEPAIAGRLELIPDTPQLQPTPKSRRKKGQASYR